MSEPEPRVVSREQIHGSGEHSFDGSGLTGVNLICDAGHEHQFVSAVIFDEETGFAVPRDAVRHGLQDPDGAVRSRWKFRCVQCHRSVTVRAEKLDAIIARLVQHGVTELTLTGLRGILAGK